MKWSIFLVFGFIAMACEVSLRHVLALSSFGHISPSFVAILLVFIAFFAPRMHAMWAAWVLGLFVDLSTDLMHGADRAGPLIGPYALGFPFGCLLLLQVRAMLFRSRVLTMSVMTTAFLAAASIVIVALYAVHSWYPDEALFWSHHRPGIELLHRVGIAVYSGVLAIIVAPILLWTIPLWSFRGSGLRTAWR